VPTWYISPGIAELCQRLREREPIPSNFNRFIIVLNLKVSRQALHDVVAFIKPSSKCGTFWPFFKFLPATIMEPPARHSPSMEDKEKDILSEELRPDSPGSLLALPEAGSPKLLLAERKLNIRLLPTVFVSYIMNFIDVSLLATLLLI
jgi:hypothetical protein